MKTVKITLIFIILSLIASVAFATPLLYESFEEEWNTSSPWGPIGWSESDVAAGNIVGNSTWSREQSDDAVQGTHIAYVGHDEDDPACYDWLITPALDLTANDRTDYLEYYICFPQTLRNNDFYVMISTDGGSTWSTLRWYNFGNVLNLTSFTRQTIDLSAYNDESNVKIGFYFNYATGIRSAKLDCVTVDEYPPSTLLEGTVTDNNSNPLQGVRVYADNDEYGRVTMYTNENGLYSDSLIIGTYSVEFYKDSYTISQYNNVVLDSGLTSTLDASLDVFPLVINPAQIDTTVSFAGTSSASFSMTNNGATSIDWSASIFDPTTSPAKGSIGYVCEIVDHVIATVNIDNSSLTTLYPYPFRSLAGDFSIESADSIYLCDHYSHTLTILDVMTGNYHTIGPLGIDELDDMACDRTTGIMYGVYENTIYTIDLLSGVCTPVGNIGNTGGAIYGLAIDGKGKMWGHDVIKDELWSIDKETGAGISVGSTGFDAVDLVGSMAWDPITECIYLMSWSFSSLYYDYLYSIDTDTGVATEIASYELKHVTVLAFPDAASPLWMTMNTKEGTISPGETIQDTIHFFANDDAVGTTHTCKMVFEESGSTVTVPVTLTVGDAEYGILTGAVTSTNGGTPVDSALITVINEDRFTWSAYTNSFGEYMIDNIIEGNNFMVECTAYAYNTAIEDSVLVVAFGTTTLDFSLNAPVMTVTPISITEQVPPYSPLDIEITIGNTEGSGELNWIAEITDQSPRKTLSLPSVSDNYPRGYQSDDNFYDLAPIDIEPRYGKNDPAFTAPKGSRGYGFETTGSDWISINTDSPDSLITVFDGAFQTYAGAFGIDSEEHMYCCNNSTKVLVDVDIATGNYTTIGSIGLSTYLLDMACDKSTGIMYGISTNNSLYIVDLTSGAATLVGAIGSSGMIAIAIDGEGNMWGHDVLLDEIWAIDKETGAGTAVGSTGFDANYAQSMAWDPLTNIVYLAAFNVSNYYYELRAVDTSTGATSLLGGVYSKEVTVLSFPGDGTIPWITLDPEVDVVPAGESSILTATFNTRSHSCGEELSCNILLHSDPDVGTFTVPVTITVDEDSYGTLTGTVTSGDNGLPIEDALITATNATNETYSVYSNSSGVYTISDIIATNYTVECTADGYNVSSDSVVVEASQTATLDFSLHAPVMTVSPSSITEEILQNSSMQVEIIIDNTEGSGELNWTAEVANQIPKDLSLPEADDDFPRGTNEVSFALAPEPSSPAYGENEPEFSPLSGSLGYGYEVIYSNVISIDTENVDMITLFSPSFSSYAGEFGVESSDSMYFCNNETWELLYVDMATGAYRTIGSLGVILYDMACDRTTGIMYGLGENVIYTIDLTTGVCTLVGSIGSSSMISIAIDGSGTMWGIDMETDELWSIDKETGTGTSIGSIGFDTNYIQSMAWDPQTNIVYMAAYNNSNNFFELRAVDTSSGNTALIGGSYYKEVTVLSFPGIIDWIYLDHESGTVPAGQSTTLTATLSTYGYDVSETLVCNVVIDSDPDVGTATIPVTVTVVGNSTGEEPEEYETKLLGNFPNPMLNTTTFSFSIKEHSHVKLSVYNVRGQLVETILDEDVEPTASYNVVWEGTSNGKKLANGIYFYKLETNSQSFLKKMILMR